MPIAMPSYGNMKVDKIISKILGNLLYLTYLCIMKIEPTYVTFEQAKLLKEKEFDLMVNAYFEDNGREELIQNKYQANYNCSTSLGLTHSKPEQWQVVEWLRLKHGIHIHNETDSYGEDWYPKLSICSKESWENLELRNIINKFRYGILDCKTPQEAYSAAFDYVLSNLI